MARRSNAGRGREPGGEGARVLKSRVFGCLAVRTSHLRHLPPGAHVHRPCEKTQFTGRKERKRIVSGGTLWASWRSVGEG